MAELLGYDKKYASIYKVKFDCWNKRWYKHSLGRIIIADFRFGYFCDNRQK